MSAADRGAAPPLERVIDLTNTDVVVEAAQIAVEQIQAVLGGGPWCITVHATGEVLATTGTIGATPSRVIPLPADGLDLVAMDDGGDGIVVEESVLNATIHRIGRLVAAVVEAEGRARREAERARLVEANSVIDGLTGLLDQGAWWSRVAEVEAQVRRHPREVAIAVIDLDGLKETNDTKGHLHGDLLIRLAAATLTTVVRTGDVVARVGGDEFAVMAIDHDATATVLAQRIGIALADAGVEASVGASTHRRGTSLQSTFAAADRAMYDAKRQRTLDRDGEA
jgi:diguanylate cyclase (GGDEF)-like protein